MDTSKVVIVGAGRMGARRAGTLAGNSRAQIVAILDPVEDRAKELAKKHGCEAASDFDALTYRGQVDAVVISTPNDQHAEVAVRSLQAGRHVFCEKPLSNTLADARRMQAAAVTSGRVLRVGANARCFGNVRKSLELVREGAIGRPLYCRGWIGFERAIGRNDASYYDPQRIGGGVLVDVGHHLADLGRAFLGDFTSAFGYSPTPLSAGDSSVPPLESTFVGTLRNDHGQWFSLQASWQEYSGYLFMEVAGEKGSVVVDGRRGAASASLTAAGGATQTWDFQAEGNVSFSREMEGFLQAVQAGRDSEGPTGADGVATLQNLHSLYTSWKTGSWAPIHVPGPTPGPPTVPSPA